MESLIMHAAIESKKLPGASSNSDKFCMDTLIKIDDLSIHFGGLIAVSKVSFQVNEGLIYALIGPNGAGKTTILNMINGLYRPSSGDITFEQKSIVGLPPHLITQLGIARTFQNIQVFEGLNVLENIMVARHVRSTANPLSTLLKTPGARREERVITQKATDVLEFVGLADRSTMDAVSLPHGQKRLMEIARALATEPKLILLDEPSAGMNEKEIQDLVELIHHIRNQGITLILIEHNMPLVMNISDRICVLDFGTKVAEGKPFEIQNNPNVIEAYLGSNSKDHG
jgi:branched-chain amino acid transport system ATP-binding protein